MIPNLINWLLHQEVSNLKSFLLRVSKLLHNLAAMENRQPLIKRKKKRKKMRRKTTILLMFNSGSPNPGPALASKSLVLKVVARVASSRKILFSQKPIPQKELRKRTTKKRKMKMRSLNNNQT